MIPRFSPIWQFREPDDRGQRRAELVADVGQERGLRRARALRRGPGGDRLLGRVSELGRARRDPGLELAVGLLERGVESGVRDGCGQERPDREQERPHRALQLASGQAIVDGEDPDRATARDQRRAKERGHLESPREEPVRLVRVLVDVPEDHRTVRPGELDERRAALVKRDADLAGEGRDLGAAADCPAIGQDVQDRVDEEHEGPIERQAMDHRVEGSIEPFTDWRTRVD